MPVETASAPDDARLLGTPVATRNQAALAVAEIQEESKVDDQAAATAEIARANAQATLNAANATLSAVLAQDALHQSQMAEMATAGAQARVDQEHKDELAASTQTAVANNIATQTRAAAATSQWYADQARQREEQRRGPIAFLWMGCLPISIVLVAGLLFWGFWRRQKIQPANQGDLDRPVDQLQAPAPELMQHQQDDPVRRWLDEIKRTLSHRERDHDDNSNG